MTTRIGIIGVGKWGKSLLKEFTRQAEVVWICHTGAEENVQFLKENYPHVKVTTDYREVLRDPSLQAIVVATPTKTHFELARQALEAHKHLFLEKPGTNTSQELEELCNLAEKNNLKFSVGYEFTYHPILSKIKELTSKEKVLSAHFEWFKWGSFQDTALVNLFCHDISIMITLGIVPDTIENYRSFSAISESDIMEVSMKSGEILITGYVNRLSLDKKKTITLLLKTAHSFGTMILSLK
jgi:predicted dehydrogenase